MSLTPAPSLLGWWSSDGTPLAIDPASVAEAVNDLFQPLYIVSTTQGYALARGGRGAIGPESHDAQAYPVIGFVPPIHPENMGDPSFNQDHGTRYAYVSGGMAAGIGSAEIVEALGRAGMMGMFGSAGLGLPRVEAAIDRIQANIPGKPYGFNLIHSPHDPSLERGVVELYIQRGVMLAEASAFLDLTINVVRYRTHGIHRGPNGEIVTPNRVMCKVSRVEVASKFFAPPPAKMLSQLVDQGLLTQDQAKLAEQIPIAQDLTAEADSGGHTDNRPAVTLIPTMLNLRERAMAQYKFAQPLRVGAAGGVSTPASAAAGYAMGASYVMVGSVNQACVESGTCDVVRQMLADAEQADTTMCPAADMFEMGVKVQVLKRGTMFPMRASKLYDLYREYPSIDALPANERATIEKTIFKCSLDDVWNQTETFFTQRDPSQVTKAAKDPKHKMALIFRWYLGQASRWANSGLADRRLDYQIWCGPAMGAFNEWAQGTFLQQPANRNVTVVGYNLIYGAAVMMRLNSLRSQGFPVPAEALHIAPREVDDLRTVGTVALSLRDRIADERERVDPQSASEFSDWRICIADRFFVISCAIATQSFDLSTHQQLPAKPRLQNRFKPHVRHNRSSLTEPHTRGATNQKSFRKHASSFAPVVSLARNTRLSALDTKGLLMPDANLMAILEQAAHEILVWVGFGTLVGLSAKGLMPGRDPGGAVGTMLMGIVGSLIGCGVLLLFNTSYRVTPVSPLGFCAGTAGAFLLLLFYRLLSNSYIVEAVDGNANGKTGASTVTYYGRRSRRKAA